MITLTTRPRALAPLILSTALLLGAGCVSERDVSEKACPCAAGWRCCASNVCVAANERCPDGSGPIEDDELVVAGQVCTSTALEVAYPVKVLLMIDTSGSMQFVDPSDGNTAISLNGSSVAAKPACLNTCQSAGQPASKCIELCSGPGLPKRQAAAAALINKLKDNPAVSFAVLRFNSTVTINGGLTKSPTFTRAEGVLDGALSSLSLADLHTDYEGALLAARDLIEADVKQASAAERHRTRYVVMFLSDGLPDPRCISGCGNDLYLGTYDSWCDAERSMWCDSYQVSGPRCEQMKSWFSELRPCADYNSSPRLRLLAKEIAQMKDDYRLGGVTFNTALLSAPALPQPIKDLLQIQTSSDKRCSADSDCTAPQHKCIADPSAGGARKCKSELEQLLIAMAEQGNGQYGSFAADTVDFLLFDYSSLFKPFGMTQLIVSNTNVRPSGTTAAVDSDGDGLADDVERKLGTDPSKADSDGDGYGDKVEHSYCQQKCDPTSASKPAQPCPAGDRKDDDGDGLNACEERLLGTSPLLVDTDRDRIPDGLEVRSGTDALSIDDKDDPDFDGKLTGDEIREHTDPNVDDAAAHGTLGYRYSIKQLPGSSDNKCFEFTVRGVRLRTTALSEENRILVYFGEAPTDVPEDYGNLKVACVRARYGPGGKLPESSHVTLVDSDFVTPYALSSALAGGGAAGADPCKGAVAP